jgi:transcription initiation factor IIE alpha subunit
MSYEEYTKEKLWPILVETVHTLIMYPSHKAYVKEIVLSEKPDTTSSELVARLKISLGEALTILCELADERRVDS